jgi:hypothetical protein
MNSGLKASAQGGVPPTRLFTQLRDQIADDQVPESAVTQHNAALDHGPLQGLADDDHLQYLLLAGRAGGQFAFGGTAPSEELELRGTTDADLGQIRVWSPIDVEDIAPARALNPFAFRFEATQVIPDTFIGGGVSVSPTINFGNGVFIWEGVRGAPIIQSDVAPVFAAFTLFNALPALRSGASGTFNPLAALVLNAGPVIEHDFTGTRTTTLVTVVNAGAQTRCGVSGATMNVVEQFGIAFRPTFSTIGGATVGLGTLRAVLAGTPSVALFQPQAGTQAMTAYYGLDVEDIDFSGDVEKAAVRSAIPINVDSWFLLNTGGAWSDFGTGFIRFDDNAGVIFGSGTDVFIRWNSVTQAIETNTFFGMANSPVHFRPNGDNSWDWFSTNPLGLAYNVEQVSFGFANAAPGTKNWFVIFQGIDGRSPGAGAGDYTDVLWTAGGDIDIGGLAMTDVQAFRIDPPSIIGAGSVADLSNLFLAGMPTAGSNRVHALRTLGRARIDGHMNNGSQQPAQITGNQNDYQLAQDNAQRAMVLLDSDAEWNITGIDSSFGFAQPGDRIFLCNSGAFDLSLTHQDVASLAANRFITPEGLPYVLHPQRGVWIWYDDTGVDRWVIMATFGHLERTLHLSGDQFRKGATAPTDVTIGATPTVTALHFALTTELASLYHSLPDDLDHTQDVILRLQMSLSAVETNLDTCDFTCDYTAPTLVTAEGVAKASTQVTGQFTAVTGRLAIGDLYEMDITFPAGDATNPLLTALGIAFEIHLTNLTGVGEIDILDGDFIYTALRS